MLINRLLYHLRIDIETAGYDHVFLAVDDEEIAIFVHVADVAGAKISTRESGCCFIRPAPITARDIGAADADLPDLAGGQFAQRIVESDDSEFDSRHRQTDCAKRRASRRDGSARR